MHEPAPTGTTPRFLATFDIEDWFHAENVRASLPSADPDSLEARIEPNAHELLDILAEAGVRSTMFVLGWVAERYPTIVHRIVDEGHELASHTHLHRNLNRLSRDEVVRELAQAKDALEQVSGLAVRGVRAPNFSVSDEVLDVLAEAGYWYDSSYFGFAQHDRYGHVSMTIDAQAPVVEVRPDLLENPDDSRTHRAADDSLGRRCVLPAHPLPGLSTRRREAAPIHVMVHVLPPSVGVGRR